MALQENSPAVSIDGHENVPTNDEDALLKAVANQPVSVAIDAGGSDFQFYSEVNSESFSKRRSLFTALIIKHSPRYMRS